MWARFGEKIGSMFRGRTPKNKMTIIKFKAKNNLNKIKGGIKKVGKKALNLADKYPMTTLSTGLVGGAYAYSNTKSAKANKNKLISEFKKLPKSDPRYKSLKKSGYI